MLVLYVSTYFQGLSIPPSILPSPNNHYFWMNHLSLPHMDFDNDMLFNFIELGVRVIQLLPSSVCDCFRILPNLDCNEP